MQENRLKFELWTLIPCMNINFSSKGVIYRGSSKFPVSTAANTSFKSHLSKSRRRDLKQKCTCKWNFFVCGHFVRVERCEVCELCRSFLVSIVINCRLILWIGSFLSFSEYCFQNFRAFMVRWINNSSLYYLFLIGTNVNQAVSE